MKRARRILQERVPIEGYPLLLIEAEETRDVTEQCGRWIGVIAGFKTVIRPERAVQQLIDLML
ncbi:hypothetical protein ACOBQB_12030 [Streptomyces sp. G5(2025)]|uniref:hypothetical protein n=1 Tax=Streptomyces sp. G5(2025) TaxID=3406628 RepID=UPI003C170817